VEAELTQARLAILRRDPLVRIGVRVRVRVRVTVTVRIKARVS
jgi:hypothetical protein